MEQYYFDLFCRKKLTGSISCFSFKSAGGSYLRLSQHVFTAQLSCFSKDTFKFFDIPLSKVAE